MRAIDRLMVADGTDSGAHRGEHGRRAEQGRALEQEPARSKAEGKAKSRLERAARRGEIERLEEL